VLLLRLVVGLLLIFALRECKRESHRAHSAGRLFKDRKSKGVPPGS